MLERGAIAYRRDIDGLRAIAVLAVVGFHAEIASLKGGFVGVDIFFVISGYLISGLIFRALARDKFSFREFYTRRINRIFPALAVVLSICLVAGWVILMPTEYQSLGKHTFGGSAFISNVLLWREAGYFDSANKPLLHLWSLAVEEQFYLLWPITAVFVWRRKWNVAAVLIAIIALSFASSLWSVRHGNSTAAFYFPGGRFWEILAGALLAQIESSRTTSTDDSPRPFNLLREASSVLGLVFIAVTIASVDSNTPWPGWWGAVPVTAALLLIGGGPATWVNKNILGSTVLVAVGLISYPLYLWHWPLMVGAKLVNGGPVSAVAMTAIVILSLLLAWATYRIVEIPIRFGARKRRSAMILFPVMAGVGLLGIAVQRGIVKPRLFAAASQLDAARRDWEYPNDGGLNHFGGDLVIDSIAGSSSDAVVFLGDSHVQQYRPRVAELSKRGSGFPTTLFLAYGSCPPMANVERRAGNSPLTHKPFECARFHNLAMSVVREPRVRAVVLAAYWDSYLPGHATYLVGDSSGMSLTQTGYRADSAFSMFARELKSLTDAGKHVYIVLSNPASKAFDPVTMLPSRVPGLSVESPRLFVPKPEALAKTASVTERLRKVAAESGAILLDPMDILCDASKCPTVSPSGAPIYIDDNHMRASFVRARAKFLDTVYAAGPGR